MLRDIGCHHPTFDGDDDAFRSGCHKSLESSALWRVCVQYTVVWIGARTKGGTTGILALYFEDVVVVGKAKDFVFAAVYHSPGLLPFLKPHAQQVEG